MTLRPYFECIGCHVVLTVLFAFVLLGVVAYTQPLWAPFDDCKPIDAQINDYNFTSNWRCTVYRRYPVEFSRRLVHAATGYNTQVITGKGKTLATGEFPLFFSLDIPTEARALYGQWCLLIGVEIRYNALHTQVQVYPPACAFLAPDE